MTNPSLSPEFPETDPQRLVDILLALDAVQYALRRLQVHYDGVAAIEYLSPEAREALEGRLSEIYVNVPRLVVSSIAERLNITGFTGADADLAEQIWYANDLDVQGDLAHSEALLFGRSYSWVWAGENGPRISIESAPQTAVLADPGTREITSAVKRWHVADGLGVGNTEAVLLLPNQIERWASTLGAEIGGFSLVGVQPNPLGVVPVAQFTNQGRLLNSWGYRGIDEIAYPSRLLMGSGVYSEIDDVIPLSSALSKALFDLMCCLEATGRPRRYASGIELMERPRLDHQGNPVLDM
jgi:Phage portal protein, SPP1 Gp6-like